MPRRSCGGFEYGMVWSLWRGVALTESISLPACTGAGAAGNHVAREKVCVRTHCTVADEPRRQCPKPQYHTTNLAPRNLRRNEEGKE
ncbi:uncharacterized protein K452DRAFT_51094 [Aplosporella prunicola CBS 121167]|uniref:Uncharacterized protein n=1 Tax=Aplosporella prunicola CBS 121167 TaxID=1176127 RepID=A0A6A6BC14_9PEZI|nr:uncharacterized protein K452DRAFT_51094 [Aplosporella prunicola CBS 121167]KAF2140775.1 hypothetical protein K452DRAFT_51094 [Aplosporella prunicola CBS 121167]